MRHDRGIIQVYTGNGKGKTSAAWGQSLRAVGRGWKVAVVRFMKPGKSGEVMAAEEFLPAVSVFGKSSSHDPSTDQRHSPVAQEESRLNFATASGLIASGEYDLVVLDELNIVLFYGFLDKDEVLPILTSRAEHVDLVITGRHAPDWLIEAADLVTEMVELKHPCADGLPARIGIEL